jgi:hypothetical protein
MTRTGSTKTVPKDHWRGRLAKARGFLKLAKSGIDLHDPGDDPDVYCAVLVKAAIGYADALTAAARQKVNQHDHKAVVQLLRDGFGNKLPKAIETKLANIMSRKDEVEYGAKLGRMELAKRMLDDTEAVAEWAEAQLAAMFPGQTAAIAPSTEEA